MYSIEPNAVLEAALDAAFVGMTSGKAKLVFQDRKPCEVVVLRNGRQDDVILLPSGEADIHFFHNHTGNYGQAVGVTNRDRYRTWYVISFGAGCLSVDCRRGTVAAVKYKPDNGHHYTAVRPRTQALTLA